MPSASTNPCIPILPWMQASVFDSGKLSLCAPFSDIYNKWLDEICNPGGDDDLHMSHRPWASLPFLKHAVCSELGGTHDWCNRIIGSWVEFFKPSIVSQATLTFWNEVPSSERSFRCNSGLLIPATNRPQRVTSKCPSKLHLDAWRWRRIVACRFVGVPDQKFGPFDELELLRPDVTLNCLLNFCDWSVPLSPGVDQHFQ